MGTAGLFVRDPLDLSQKTIPTARQRLEGIARAAQGFTDAVDRVVQPVLELDVDLGGPDPFLQLFPRHDVTGVLEEKGESAERAPRKPQQSAFFSKLLRSGVELERAEPVSHGLDRIYSGRQRQNGVVAIERWMAFFSSTQKTAAC